MSTVERGATNLPNSPDRPEKTMIPFLLAHLDFSLGRYQCLSRWCAKSEETFITSNGCVANVPTAPAAAAEKLCTTADSTPELGGIRRPARNVNRGDGGSKESLTYFLLDILIDDHKYTSVRSVTESGRGESSEQLRGASPNEGYQRG